jgi:hypothetical protein
MKSSTASTTRFQFSVLIVPQLADQQAAARWRLLAQNAKCRAADAKRFELSASRRSIAAMVRSASAWDWSRIAVGSAIRDQFSAEASMLRVDARELCGVT